MLPFASRQCVIAETFGVDIAPEEPLMVPEPVCADVVSAPHSTSDDASSAVSKSFISISLKFSPHLNHRPLRLFLEFCLKLLCPLRAYGSGRHPRLWAGRGGISAMKWRCTSRRRGAWEAERSASARGARTNAAVPSGVSAPSVKKPSSASLLAITGDFRIPSSSRFSRKALTKRPVPMPPDSFGSVS